MRGEGGCEEVRTKEHVQMCEQLSWLLSKQACTPNNEKSNYKPLNDSYITIHVLYSIHTNPNATLTI